MDNNSILSNVNIYFVLLLALHIFISMLLSFFISQKLRKRFILNSQKVNKHDLLRFKEMSNKTPIHKFLFHVSLHKNNIKASFAYFLIFNFSMPVLGYFASLWLSWYLINVKYQDNIVNTNMLNLDEFGVAFVDVERIFGEGSLNELMKNKYAPKSKKLRALNVLSATASPANLKIIKQTLSSTEDEIRMFGYAIINKAEQKISNNINIELGHFKDAKKELNAHEVARAANELAFLYWELLYTELSHDSLNDEFMQQVDKFAHIAIDYYAKELKAFGDGEENIEALNKLSKLYQLLGRIFMKNREYEKAIEKFTIAQELNLENATFILPYTAEAYFLLGKYHLVHSLLKQMKSYEVNVTVQPMIEQWKRSS